MGNCPLNFYEPFGTANKTLVISGRFTKIVNGLEKSYVQKYGCLGSRQDIKVKLILDV